MSSDTYLAFYKGKKKGKGIKAAYYRFFDWLIRTVTKGEFSHVEIVTSSHKGIFECYSSSIRDGGVRRKLMPLNSDDWVLVPIDPGTMWLSDYYEQTKHQKYDFLGAIASTIPFVQKKDRQFCSEWCYNALEYGRTDGWRFSPNDLYAIYSTIPQPYL